MSKELSPDFQLECLEKWSCYRQKQEFEGESGFFQRKDQESVMSQSGDVGAPALLVSN